MKSEVVGLGVRAISFQDFQPMWSWSTNVTDGQTDRQTDKQTDDMRWQDRALHYSASRGKKAVHIIKALFEVLPISFHTGAQPSTPLVDCLALSMTCCNRSEDAAIRHHFRSASRVWACGRHAPAWLPI